MGLRVIPAWIPIIFKVCFITAGATHLSVISTMVDRVALNAWNTQNMVETHVTPNFVFDPKLYSSEELQCLDKTVDLFCRIKNTNQAEMMATVMFSYDELCKKMNKVTELDVFNDVLDWKSHWIGVREDEIKRTIRSLLIFDWIQPEISFADDDELDL